MQFVVVVVGLTLLAVGALGGPEEMMKNIEACKTEVGAADEEIKALFKDGSEPSDPKFKCFFSCMMKSMGKMGADGSIVKDMVLKDLPPGVDRAQFEAAVTECQEQKGSDDCDTAYLIHKCMMSKKVMPPPPMA